jgi:hypothetical protein
MDVRSLFHAPLTYHTGNKHNINWIERWVYSRAGLDIVAKDKFFFA